LFSVQTGAVTSKEEEEKTESIALNVCRHRKAKRVYIRHSLETMGKKIKK
jgi:hypothetical protein